jgi:allantoinase
VGFHGEIDLIIEDLIARAKRAGRTQPMAHYETRPPASETLAILKLLELAYWTKVKLHVFHTSQPRSVEMVQWFKAQGVDVSVETCPHYLLLDAERDLPRVKGFAKINPSILRQPEREGLWEHLLAGRVDIIASDHAPWLPERKTKENIFENASGAPGLETSLPLMHDALVAKRGQDPSRVARLLSGNPARRFCLAPRKGSIGLGADADFAILDPRQTLTIDATQSYSSAKWSPYDGWTVQGKVVRTILRGKTIFDGQKVVGQAGTGQFLPGPGLAR